MREFNENILESLDDGLVVFDLDERVVRWNRALEGFYGVMRGEAIGRPLGEIFDATFVEALRVGWYGVLDLVIALIHVWPLWLALGLGVYGLRRWLRTRRAARAMPPPPPAAE